MWGRRWFNIIPCKTPSVILIAYVVQYPSEMRMLSESWRNFSTQINFALTSKVEKFSPEYIVRNWISDVLKIYKWSYFLFVDIVEVHHDGEWCANFHSDILYPEMVWYLPRKLSFTEDGLKADTGLTVTNFYCGMGT